MSYSLAPRRMKKMKKMMWLYFQRFHSFTTIIGDRIQNEEAA